jgi:hypothetical protein
MMSAAMAAQQQQAALMFLRHTTVIRLHKSVILQCLHDKHLFGAALHDDVEDEM